MACTAQLSEKGSAHQGDTGTGGGVCDGHHLHATHLHATHLHNAQHARTHRTSSYPTRRQDVQQACRTAFHRPPQARARSILAVDCKPALELRYRQVWWCKLSLQSVCPALAEPLINVSLPYAVMPIKTSECLLSAMLPPRIHCNDGRGT